MNWRYLCAPVVSPEGGEGRLTGVGWGMPGFLRRRASGFDDAGSGELYQRYQSVVAALIYVKRALQCRVFREGRY
ncbi:hypothetical protein PT2222_190081 [Paraburkholderia tropica]